MEFVSRRVDMITTGSVFSSRDPLITRRWKNYSIVSYGCKMCNMDSTGPLLKCIMFLF